MKTIYFIVLMIIWAILGVYWKASGVFWPAYIVFPSVFIYFFQRVFTWKERLMRFSDSFLTTGVFLNGLVIICNGGMPVKDLASKDGMWIPIVPSTKFVILSDILPKYFSIGDFFIIGGILLGFFSLFFVKKSANAT